MIGALVALALRAARADIYEELGLDFATCTNITDSFIDNNCCPYSALPSNTSINPLVPASPSTTAILTGLKNDLDACLLYNETVCQPAITILTSVQECLDNASNLFQRYLCTFLVPPAQQRTLSYNVSYNPVLEALAWHTNEYGYENHTLEAELIVTGNYCDATRNYKCRQLEAHYLNASSHWVAATVLDCSPNSVASHCLEKSVYRSVQDMLVSDPTLGVRLFVNDVCYGGARTCFIPEGAVIQFVVDRAVQYNNAPTATLPALATTNWFGADTEAEVLDFYRSPFNGLWYARELRFRDADTYELTLDMLEGLGILPYVSILDVQGFNRTDNTSLSFGLSGSLPGTSTITVNTVGRDLWFVSDNFQVLRIVDEPLITGSVPASLFKHASLRHLELHNTGVSGVLPVDAKDAANLEHFQISYPDSQVAVTVSGVLPLDLTNVHTLDFSNAITLVPNALDMLAALTYTRLRTVKIRNTNAVITDLEPLLTTLDIRYLDISENSGITANIAHVSNLQNLEYIDVRGTNMIGIPPVSQLCNMPTDTCFIGASVPVSWSGTGYCEAPLFVDCCDCLV